MKNTEQESERMKQYFIIGENGQRLHGNMSIFTIKTARILSARLTAQGIKHIIIGG